MALAIAVIYSHEVAVNLLHHKKKKKNATFFYEKMKIFFDAWKYTFWAVWGGGQFRGSCARLSVPAGHRNGESRWGRIWGLGGNAYGERRARLREPATSVASKKSDDNSPSTSISSIESMGD